MRVFSRTNTLSFNDYTKQLKKNQRCYESRLKFKSCNINNESPINIVQGKISYLCNTQPSDDDKCKVVLYPYGYYLPNFKCDPYLPTLSSTYTDGANQQTTTYTDSNGNTTTTYTDANGNTTTTYTDAGGTTTTYTDANGNTTTTYTDTGGTTTTYTDSRGNSTTTYTDSNGVTSTTYTGSNGNTSTTYTDANGNVV